MSQTTTIPQPVLDTYNAHYNNQTYRAFSAALAAALGLDERVTQLETYDERHNRIMNLLIDTSLELSGAEFYAGAGQRLGNALGALDEHTPALVKLASTHLDHFADRRTPLAGTRADRPHGDTGAGRIGASCAGADAGSRGPAAGLARHCSLLLAAGLHADHPLRRDCLTRRSQRRLPGREVRQRYRDAGMGTGEIVRYGNPPPAIRQFHEQLTAQRPKSRAAHVSR